MIEEGEDWREELQEEMMSVIREVTVVLSASNRNVEWAVKLEDVKVAVYRGPPGLVVLSGRPYYAEILE